MEHLVNIQRANGEGSPKVSRNGDVMVILFDVTGNKYTVYILVKNS